MRWNTVRMLALVVASALAASACSGSSTETGGAPAAASQTSTSAPSTSSTTAGDATPLPLPQTDDPCGSDVDLAVGLTEYAFEFEGTTLPVGVEVTSGAALSDPVVVVSLHAGGFPWSHTIQAWEHIWPQFGSRSDNLIVFYPQSDDTETPWWTKTRDFNGSYLAGFFESLRRVVCVGDSPVFLTGFGQSTVAVTQAHCEGALDVELTAIVLLMGMTKMLECDPVNAVPIVSIDRFEFSPTVGPHWDGRWDMPRPIDLDLTGGLAATPDDLAEWSDVYRCEGPPVTDEIPDPTGSLDRLTMVLSHRDCQADLVAIGIAGAPDGNRVFDPTAVEQMLALLGNEFARLLDEP